MTLKKQVDLLLVLAGLLSTIAPAYCVADFEAVLDAGKERYGALCAGCHGRDGKAAHAKKIKPADLSVLSKNSGGSFPFERVYNAIDGRDMPPVHGDRRMPVWGTYLKRRWPGSRTEGDVRGQILEVIMYVLTLQEQTIDADGFDTPAIK